MNMHTRWLTVVLSVALTATIFLPSLAHAADKPAAANAQKTFASPDEAVKALVEAVRASDNKTLLKILGSDARTWLSSGDSVADQGDRERFLAKYDAKNALVMEGDEKAILNVGEDDWPFAAPIVKRGDSWAFDAVAGREEVINRRVGRNELDTIQTLRAIVDAQREYAAADADKNGFHDYARKFRSRPGKKDGLYWPAQADEPESPLGPLLAVASREGYDLPSGKAKQQPYHGYYYKILTRQGKDAPGGAFDYLVKGKLLGGFAVVAYPVSYGVSGVQTFVISHDATLYEKDLGPATAKTAPAMTTFNPDSSWSEVTDMASASDL